MSSRRRLEPAGIRTSWTLTRHLVPERRSPPAWVATGALSCAVFCVVALAGLALGMWLLPAGQIGRSATLWPDLIRWDANAYLEIARRGYAFTPHHLATGDSIAYFPGYAMVEWLLLRVPGMPFVLVAVAPAFLAGISAIFAFSELAHRTLAASPARWATLGFAIFPGASFMLGGYPTTILNLLAVLVLANLLKGRPWRAAGWSGLATLFGPLAAVVAFAIPLVTLRHRRGRWMRTVLTLLGQVSIAEAGLLAFCGFQWARFSTPLAFVTAENHWGSASLVTRLVRAVTLSPFTTYYGHPWIGPPGNPPLSEFVMWLQCVGSVVAFGFILVMLLEQAHHRPTWLAITGFLVLAAYYWATSTLIGPISGFRLLYIDVPAFLGLGHLAERHRLLATAITAGLGICLALQIGFSLAGYTVV